MEIHNITNVLFENIDVVKNKYKPKNKVLQTKTPDVSKEAKTLEYQLNKHMHNKYKLDTKVSFIHTSKTDCIEDFVIDEIANSKKKKKSWNSLNTCDKWSLVKTYYQQNKKSFNEKLLKKHVLSNTLKVVYDNQNNCITEVSY
jgi:magnesium-transporting ATPase (P-type)